MNNILLDELPTSYNGYEVNTSFRIGIQIALVRDDAELDKNEKWQLIIDLLFGNADGTYKPIPKTQQELTDILAWYVNGWYHDRHIPSENDKKRLIDYDIDQFRIYADFINIYGIDLSVANLHWWAFQGLLWNMPHERSSFLQTIEIRTKKPRKGASAEEKKRIEQGHRQFDLKQIKAEKVYTKEEENKIDAYDAFMKKSKEKKKQIKEDINEALEGF